jgi:hypothetical protein
MIRGRWKERNADEEQMEIRNLRRVLQIMWVDGQHGQLLMILYSPPHLGSGRCFHGPCPTVPVLLFTCSSLLGDLSITITKDDNQFIRGSLAGVQIVCI